MHGRLLASALAALLAVGCRRAADGPSAVFRLETWPANAESADAVATAARVLDNRFKRDALGDIEVTSSAGDLVTVTLPKRLEDRAESIWGQVERVSRLEFRAVADQARQREFARIRDADGEEAEPPTGCRWVPRPAGVGGELVLTPEAPLSAELHRLDVAGVARDTAEYQSVLERYAEAVRDEVFTGDQLAKVELRQGDSAAEAKYEVYFEFKEERKAYFDALVARHAPCFLAIIIDGEIDRTPVLLSGRGGAGVFECRSPIAKIEAMQLATVLSSESMPGRLVRVRSPETK